MCKLRIFLYLILLSSISPICAADYSNELRMILQQDRYADVHHTEGAVLLKLGIESELASYLKGGAAVYGALPIRSTPGELLGPNGRADAILGEAWIEIGSDSSSARIGRIRLDWPLLNSNDMSLMPNLFEAIDVHTRYDEHWAFTLGHARKMAGWENGRMGVIRLLLYPYQKPFIVQCLVFLLLLMRQTILPLPSPVSTTTLKIKQLRYGVEE